MRDLSKHIVKINWPRSDDKVPARRAEIEALAYAKIFDESVVEGLMGLMLKHAERYQNLTIYLQSDGAGSHGIVLSALEGGDVETWQDRILDAGFEHLREGKAKKVVGISPLGYGHSELVGLRYEPAQAEAEAAHPVKEVIDNILKLAGEGRRFYAILSTETSENLKKREAEQDEDDEEEGLLLPSF